MSDPAVHDEPPATTRARARWFIAALALLIAPAVYSFGFDSFLDAKLAALAAAGVLLAVLGGRINVDASRTTLAAWSCVAASLAYAVLIQAPLIAAVPSITLSRAAELALLVVTALLIHDAFSRGESGRRSLRILIAASALPVAALGLFQFAGWLPGMFPVFPEYTQRMYSVFGNQDLFAGYLAITLPLWIALGLRRAVPLAAAVAGCALIVPAIALSGSRSAWLAAAAGCVVAAVVTRAKPVRSGLLLLIVVVAAAGLAAFLAPEATLDRFGVTFSEDDTGYHVRRWIWEGAARMIGDHPVAGVGLGNFAYESPAYLGEAARAHGPGLPGFNRIPVVHAHSDPLEVLAEGGVTALVLVAAFVLLALRRAAPETGVITAYVVFGLLNTTLHSPPHLIVFLLAAITALTPRQGRPPTRSRRFTQTALVTCGCVALAILVAVATLVPSWQLARAQMAYESRHFVKAEQLYRRAVGWLWPDDRAAYDLAVFLANDRRYKEAEEFADRARRGIDTGDIHFLQGYIAERQNDTTRAREAYERCLARWPSYEPAWDRLIALAPPEEKDAVRERAASWIGERTGGGPREPGTGERVVPRAP